MKCEHAAVPRWFFSDAEPGNFRYGYSYCAYCGRCYFPPISAQHLLNHYHDRLDETIEYLREQSCLDISDLKDQVI